MQCSFVMKKSLVTIKDPVHREVPLMSNRATGRERLYSVGCETA